MNTGPYELVLVTFPRHRFRGETFDALHRLVQSRTVRVVDILFISKDDADNMSVVEMTGLSDEDYQLFDPLVSDTAGFLSEHDARAFMADVPRGASAALMLLEDTWPRELYKAAQFAGGDVVIRERVPQSVLNKVSAA